MIYTDIHSHKKLISTDCLTITNLLNVDSISTELEEKKLFSIGIHPRYIRIENSQEDSRNIKFYANKKNVLAIGESGLDRLGETLFELQISIFEEMVRISEEVKKPLIIHCVKAFDDLRILHKKLKPKQPWILHGFNVKISVAKQMLDEGFYFSFGEAILKEDSMATAVLPSIPDGRFFLETDASEVSINTIFARAAILRNSSESSLKDLLHHQFLKVFNYG